MKTNMFPSSHTKTDDNTIATILLESKAMQPSLPWRQNY